jgi:hypothetical protein
VLGIYAFFYEHFFSIRERRMEEREERKLGEESEDKGAEFL